MEKREQCLHLVILQTLLSKVPLTPILRHCSNKYKLAREGEKEKDENFEKYFVCCLVNVKYIVHKIQEAIDGIEKWSVEWGFRFSISKMCCQFFTKKYSRKY